MYVSDSALARKDHAMRCKELVSKLALLPLASATPVCMREYLHMQAQTMPCQELFEVAPADYSPYPNGLCMVSAARPVLQQCTSWRAL